MLEYPKAALPIWCRKAETRERMAYAETKRRVAAAKGYQQWAISRDASAALNDYQESASGRIV